MKTTTNNIYAIYIFVFIISFHICRANPLLVLSHWDRNSVHTNMLKRIQTHHEL